MADPLFCHIPWSHSPGQSTMGKDCSSCVNARRQASSGSSEGWLPQTGIQCIPVKKKMKIQVLSSASLRTLMVSCYRWINSGSLAGDTKLSRTQLLSSFPATSPSFLFCILGSNSNYRSLWPPGFSPCCSLCLECP